jgi:hypothetical protein
LSVAGKKNNQPLVQAVGYTTSVLRRKPIPPGNDRSLQAESPIELIICEALGPLGRQALER